MMRLQKYMAACGVASRRASESLIADGHVTVNGKKITEMGFLIDEQKDRIAVDGKQITPEKEKHYIAYHKPIGEVTTVSDPEGRPTVMDKFWDYPVRLFPVGRLDYDSEGLLLLTNDGDLMQSMLHPSHEVPKKYWVKVSNHLSQDEIKHLKNGVALDGVLTSPAEVVVIREEAFDTIVLVTIHQGRNCQVRRMFEAVGHQVVQLKRVGFGPIQLGDLERGHWRKLTESEIRKLKEL